MDQKINKNIFLIIFNLFNLILFYLVIKNSNDKIIYLLFSLVSIASINYFLINWQYYTELFLNIFIYLGFWFKFSVNFAKNTGRQIAETNEYLSSIAINNNYIDVLNIISLSILSITLFFFLIKKLSLRIIKKEISFVIFNLTLKKYKIRFLICFLTIFSLIIFLNFYFDFAYLGQQTSRFFFLEKLFKYLLIIFFPLSLFLIIDVYFKIYGRSFVLILLVVFSLFLISLTLDSRALLINLIPLFLVYFRFFNYTNLNSLILRAVSFLIIIISLFIILFILVEQSRTSSNESFTLKKSLKTVEHIRSLAVNRWVGIAGMINVQYTKNKKIDMFVESLSESSQLFNYYERNYFFSENSNEPNFKDKDEFIKDLKNSINSGRISVFVPGFMAFFYYSGSLIILIFLNLLLVFFLIFVEKTYSILMSSNNFFLAMFSMILVWRIVHLGLFPLNSLLFFIVLILTPIIFLIIDKLFSYLIHEKNNF